MALVVLFLNTFSDLTHMTHTFSCSGVNSSKTIAALWEGAGSEWRYGSSSLFAGEIGSLNCRDLPQEWYMIGSSE